MSLDGYIADEDGAFAWIHGDGDKSHDTEKSFSFRAFMESVDTIVMGKKAFLDLPEVTLEDFKSHKIYVASSQALDTPYENITFIHGDICQQVLKLKEEEGKHIWLFGGAGLTDPFLKADIIDEYVFGIIPIILGKGIKLFMEKNPKISLHLKECTVQEGIPIMVYEKKS